MVQIKHGKKSSITLLKAIFLSLELVWLKMRKSLAFSYRLTHLMRRFPTVALISNMLSPSTNLTSVPTFELLT